MDFVKLNPATYVPSDLIEGYTSLIWTERFDTPGEFELKSFDIAKLTALIPEGTFVSHLETKEVMRVDTHSIEFVGEGVDRVAELTVSGKSVTSILDDRWVEGNYQVKRRMRYAYTASTALCVLLYNAVANASGKDVTRGDNNPATKTELNDYPWTTLDVLPNVVVTEVSTAPAGAARWWLLDQGSLGPQFYKMLVDADLGVRTVRPVSPNPGTQITVDSVLASRGTVRRTNPADITALRFEVYNRIDRSGSVQLSQLQGHLDDEKYLSSSRNNKTGVEIMSDLVEVSDVYRAGEAGLSGWNRRIAGMDGGSPDIPAAPDRPNPLKSNHTKAQKKAYDTAMDKYIDDYAAWVADRNNIITQFRAEQTAAAQVILKENRRINMFAGEMSILSPYKYKTHYDLGDLIMLIGDYGKTAKMMVSEYVRTENIDGDRGFPGLVEP